MQKPKNKSKALACFFISFFFSLFIANTVKAATLPNQEISVTPFLQSAQIVQDEPSKKINITFTNNSDKQQVLAISVADFGSLNKTGGVAFLGADFSQPLDKYTLTHWLTLDSDNITLNPGQKLSVVATIINDATLAPGGHYAAIVGTVVAGGGRRRQPYRRERKNIVSDFGY